MSSVFISHSSRDNDEAAALDRWLRARGYDDVFLDVDKRDGISPGMNWKGRLAQAMRRAQVVVLLVSENWFASAWCQAEHAVATLGGKPIVPVIIRTDAGHAWDELRASLQSALGDIQFADLSQGWDAGLSQLEGVLDRTRVTPLAFAIPDNAAPYKGLSAFDSEDAGLFFGRERETQEAFESLRRLSAPSSEERLFVIRGPSGSGKSSLLRAGIIPQLRLRPREWIVLGPFIPSENRLLGVTPKTEFCRSLATLGSTVASVVAAIEIDPQAEIRRIVARSRESAGAPSATVLVAIDQAEEMLRASSQEQQAFLSLLKVLLSTPGCAAVMTIRSDTFDEAQASRLFENLTHQQYALAPMPLARVPDIIRGPAGRVGLRVQNSLVDAATDDARTGDALPLLSFTLERLWKSHGGDGELTLVDYLSYSADAPSGARISPIENSVRIAAEEAIPNLTSDESQSLAAAFVPGLVDLTDALEPVRRRTVRDSLPKAALGLLDRLKEARLLQSESQNGVATLEVAHEALLRRWPLLVDLIDAAKPDLRLLQDVERAADDWSRGGTQSRRNRDLRHSGSRLGRARFLARRQEWSARLGELGREYLVACRKAETRSLAFFLSIALVAVTILGLALDQEGLRRSLVAQSSRFNERNALYQDYLYSSDAAAYAIAAARLDFLPGRAVPIGQCDGVSSALCELFYAGMLLTPDRVFDTGQGGARAVSLLKIDGSNDFVVSHEDGSVSMIDGDLSALRRLTNAESYAGDCDRTAGYSTQNPQGQGLTGQEIMPGNYNTPLARRVIQRAGSNGIAVFGGTCSLLLFDHVPGNFRRLVHHEEVVSVATYRGSADVYALTASGYVVLWHADRAGNYSAQVLTWVDGAEALVQNVRADDLLVSDFAGITVLSKADGRVLRRLRSGNNGSLAQRNSRVARVSYDGQWVVTDFGDSLRISDIGTGQTLVSYPIYAGTRYSGIAISPTNGELAMAEGGTLHMMSVTTGRERALEDSSSESAAIHRIVFSSEGTAVATSVGDRTIRIWTTDGARELARVVVQEGHALLAQPVLVEDHLYAVGGDGSLLRWDLKPQSVRAAIDNTCLRSRDALPEINADAEAGLYPGRPRHPCDWDGLGSIRGWQQWFSSARARLFRS